MSLKLFGIGALVVVLQQTSVAQIYNPVWSTPDNLRDPSVLKVADGYHLLYSRLSGSNWALPESWSIAAVFTRYFMHFENDHDVSPKGYASPGDVVFWHRRFLLPYQSYPAKPTRLCLSESADLKTWSAPRPFVTEAADLPWKALTGEAYEQWTAQCVPEQGDSYAPTEDHGRESTSSLTGPSSPEVVWPR